MTTRQCFESVLQSAFLEEYLPHPRFYQRDAACEYAVMLGHDLSLFDWPAINQGIINKWSVSGLRRVKEMAWKIAEGE